jgi:phosphate transport system permease protein
MSTANPSLGNPTPGSLSGSISPTSSGATVKPRKTRQFGFREVGQVAACLVGSIAVVAVVFAATPLAGGLGFVLVTYVTFLVTLYVLGRLTIDRKAGIDRVVTVVIGSAALVVAGLLALIVGYVVFKGAPTLRLNFFTKTLSGVDPSAPATVGGALNAIVGTLSQVGISTLVSVPFGVLTAVYLNEIKGRFAGAIRVLVDAMSGIPSIVAGLFIYTLWVVGPGKGYSGLAGSLALGILMLPTIARTTEEMLKLVNPSLREASLALGSPEWRTVMQVVLPTARTGIITATILGIARVAGETAPLLMTTFGNDSVIGPIKGLSTEQSSLPLYVFQQFGLDQRQRAWTGALVLVGLVVVLFVLARALSRPKKYK